tara:strand:- start:755 stop:1777 length:1023 start_codon:yes stop_codon:yes gene_type:complete
MSEKIFITGGAGFVGSHACLEFLKAGKSILVYDDLSNGSREALKRVEYLATRNLEFVHGDIRDGPTLNKAMVSFQPDSVVHFAGLKAVGESVAEPLKYYDVNVCGTLRLLEAMSVANCRKIVFSSSATVYGNTSVPPYDENHPISPTNPYGQTKAIIELMLRDWATADTNRIAVCLRYFNPVGAHSSGLIGEDPKGIPSNLMPYICQVATMKRQHLSIFGNDYCTRDGTGERDYVHVMDLAECHVSAVEKIFRLAPFRVINVGTGSGTTVNELISSFVEITGRSVPFKIIDRRPGDVDQSWANNTLGEQLLGITCKRSVKDMCEDAWRWQKKNPNGYQGE